MKIQLASDLHLEYLARNFPGERLIVPAYASDILVLAGDISNAASAIELFKDWPVPVLYVAGNHEFYAREMREVRAELKAAAAGTNVHFLDNDSIDFGGVRFLGTTLWTDYLLNRGMSQEQQMKAAGRYLHDHFSIHTPSGLFAPEDALVEHMASRQWLTEQLMTPYAGKTVVISHHGPHPLSIHPKYIGEVANCGFASNLTPLLFHADLWLHGHVHDNFDYTVGTCRVIANPRGYARNLNSVLEARYLEFENTGFIPNLTIDITEN